MEGVSVDRLLPLATHHFILSSKIRAKVPTDKDQGSRLYPDIQALQDQEVARDFADSFDKCMRLHIERNAGYDVNCFYDSMVDSFYHASKKILPPQRCQAKRP